MSLGFTYAPSPDATVLGLDIGGSANSGGTGYNARYSLTLPKESSNGAAHELGGGLAGRLTRPPVETWLVGSASSLFTGDFHCAEGKAMCALSLKATFGRVVRVAPMAAAVSVLSVPVGGDASVGLIEVVGMELVFGRALALVPELAFTRRFLVPGLTVRIATVVSLHADVAMVEGQPVPGFRLGLMIH